MLHGLAGRVPDAVATYCTMIRSMVNSAPLTADPMVILKTLHPFVAPHRLASLANGLLDKPMTPEEVKNCVAERLVKHAFAGQDLRHQKFCEVCTLLRPVMHPQCAVLWK